MKGVLRRMNRGPLGIFIGIGAGVGLVLALAMFGADKMVWGLLVGAALGTVVGAVASSSSKQ